MFFIRKYFIYFKNLGIIILGIFLFPLATLFLKVLFDAGVIIGTMIRTFCCSC